MWNDDNAVYGDGEWITWTEISSHLERLELKASCPGADIDLMAIFKRLLNIATDYYRLTGRHLQVYGDLGELYGAIAYDIKLHRNYAQGSDGRMGNDLVEIKTITPFKIHDQVVLNLQRNFSKVLIVKIDADFNVHGKLVARKELPKVKGDRLTLRWSDIDNDHGEVQNSNVALIS